MLRPCICMRPSPSFIPPVCFQRLWTDYGPVNILSLLEREEQDDFLTISTFLFCGEIKKLLGEGESKPRLRAPGTSDKAEVSIDVQPSHLGYLSAPDVRPSIRLSVTFQLEAVRSFALK